jgi:hypothetical protein
MSETVLEAYARGDYATAAALFEASLPDADMAYASYYADICLRDLDGAGRTVQQGALWYWKAALSGDGDVSSWLLSLFPPDTALDTLSEADVLTRIADDMEME